jgi:hypothetical protein
MEAKMVYREEMKAMREAWLGKMDAKSKASQQKTEGVAEGCEGVLCMKAMPPSRVGYPMFCIKTLKARPANPVYGH